MRTLMFRSSNLFVEKIDFSYLAFFSEISLTCYSVRIGSYYSSTFFSFFYFMGFFLFYFFREASVFFISISIFEFSSLLFIVLFYVYYSYRFFWMSD